MEKLLKVLIIAAIVFILPSISLAEDITITTYYPSPFGNYRELRAARVAIGDNYVDGVAFTWENANGDGGEVDVQADLVVEGNIGIGTAIPIRKLEVVGNSNSYSPASFVSPTGINNYGTAIGGRVGETWGRIQSFSSPAGSFVEAVEQNLAINPDGGNVGIGTNVPSQRLVVEGNCIVNGKFNGGIKGTYGPVSSPGDIAYNTYRVNFGTTFLSAPYVMLTARTSAGSPGLLVVNLQSIGTDSFVIRVSDNDYGRAGVGGVIDWVAIGI